MPHAPAQGAEPALTPGAARPASRFLLCTLPSRTRFMPLIYFVHSALIFPPRLFRNASFQFEIPQVSLGCCEPQAGTNTRAHVSAKHAAVPDVSFPRGLGSLDKGKTDVAFQSGHGIREVQRKAGVGTRLV